MNPPIRGPRDRKARAEKETYDPDKTKRPPPIPGRPIEPEIFTSHRRPSVAKRRYLVRHPKMVLTDGTGHGTSIAAGNGGADDRDTTKVIINVPTGGKATTPGKIFTDKELKGMKKARILYENFSPRNGAFSNLFILSSYRKFQK